MVYFNYDFIEDKALGDFLLRYGSDGKRLVCALENIYNKEVYNSEDDSMDDKFSESAMFALCCLVFDSSLFKDNYDNILTLEDLDKFLSIFGKEEVEKYFKDNAGSDKVTFYNGHGIHFVLNAMKRKAKINAMLDHLVINEYGKKINISDFSLKVSEEAKVIEVPAFEYKKLENPPDGMLSMKQYHDLVQEHIANEFKRLVEYLEK